MIQDFIVNEFINKKAMGSFIYLIENGREIELTYGNQTLFISKDGSQKNCSIWIDKKEQSFESIYELLSAGQICDKTICEIWDDIEVLSIY